MTSSHPILASLSELLRCPIDFVSMVKFQKKQKYIICLGRHSFFVISEDLTVKKWEINYSLIEKVHVDTGKYNIMSIIFKQSRDNPRIPDSLVMITDDRNMLLNRFKSVYKTDYMYRSGKIKNLQVVKTELILSLKDFSEEGLDTGLPSFLFDAVEMIKYRKHELKGYCYFMLNEYKPAEEGIFLSDVDKETSFFSIQISETMPLHTLSILKDREDLRHYCHLFIESVLENEVYWIISSKKYIKRTNLSLDVAEWTGWEVRARDSQNRETIAIILRRKYIPPILDTFQDFAFLIKGTSREEPEVVLKKIRGTADSIYHTGNNKVVYRIFVQEMADALLLDEDGYNFLQVNFDIKPKHIIYGLKLLDTVLNLLKMNPGVQRRYEEIQKFMKNKYKKYIEDEGHELWQEDESDKMDEKKDKKTDVFNLIETLIKHSFKSTDPLVMMTWKQKFSRYMAFCLDGGLLSEKFCISDIWKGILKQINDVQLINTISYLLYICPEKNDYDYQNLTNRINKLSSGNYNFNKRVMKSLLENNFLQMLLGHENPLQISDILCFLIKNSHSAVLERSICLSILNNLPDPGRGGSSEENEFLKSSYRQLIFPLIQLYKGKNKSLSSLAVICLINLSAAFKELKYLIAVEGGENAAIANLNCHEEGLLTYTLQFILNLCSMYQNLENFIKKKLLEEMIKIIGENPIPKVVYSEKIIVAALQILRLIINHSDSEVGKVIGNVPLFVSIIKREWEGSPKIAGEGLSLLMRVGKKVNISSGDTKKSWVELLEFLATKVPKEKSPDMLTKIFQIILNSVKTDEFYAETMRKMEFEKIKKEKNWTEELNILCSQICLSINKK